MALDFKEQKNESFMAMQSPEAFAIELLLSGRGTQCPGRDFDEPDRRAIYENAVLREPEDGGVFDSSGTFCESETGSTAHAPDGYSRDLSRPEHQPAQAGARCLSVSASRSCDRKAQSGLERRHHLCPAYSWFCVSGGDPGLVLPLRFGVEVIEQPGDGFLHRSSRRGSETDSPRYLRSCPLDWRG